MTTAADIIKQYGRVLEHDTSPSQIGNIDFEDDMQTLALIVPEYGNNPLPYGLDEITRDNLGICLAGKNHWWWNCDDHNCHEGDK